MSESRSNDTGQISVAELLARNGQKVGTRSGGRRRRGAGGGISVAELTGEIPITPAADAPSTRRSDADDTAPEPGGAASVPPKTVPPKAVPPKAVPQKVAPSSSVAPGASRAERTAPVTPKVEPQSSVEKTTVTPVRARSRTAKPSDSAAVRAVRDEPSSERTTITARATGATAAAEPATVVPTAKRAVPSPKAAVPSPKAAVPSPKAAPVPAKAKPETATAKPKSDPKAKSDSTAPKVESPTEIIRPEALPRRARVHLDTVATATPAPATESPSPKRSADAAEPRLLSGPASDLQGTGTDEARTAEPIGKVPGKRSKRAKKEPEPAVEQTGSTESDDARDGEDEAEGSGLKQWALVIGESVAAIVAGGLLFKGFERLWDLMPWVAFALALLVIVGLVALVRILRRTDDITSQLIALAVGAFVAFGPLLFLLPNG